VLPTKRTSTSFAGEQASERTTLKEEEEEPGSSPLLCSAGDAVYVTPSASIARAIRTSDTVGGV
jgi:hypothetical protein